MSSIAYITDSTMLENHRLLRNKTMNFWRLSTNINFSDFGIGDLVFFLSKDRVHRRKGEKGIIGFGRLKELRVYSPSTMWRKYGKDNGYISKKSFEDALKKVSKDNKLPSKISSMYLTDVVFLQTPTYLSEYGMQISKQVESYVYLNDINVPFNILEYAKKAYDTWTSDENIVKSLDEEQIRLCLFAVQDQLQEIGLNEKNRKDIYRKLKLYQKENPQYDFIAGTNLFLYYVKENVLKIVTSSNKAIDNRLIIGQACLYRYALWNKYPYDLDISFEVLDGEEINDIINEQFVI